MPNNKVVNELVIDADDESIGDLITAYVGVAAADLFASHCDTGASDPVKAWGCGPATAWHFEPWQPGQPLVMVIETLNARPVGWMESVLGWQLGLPFVVMQSRCPDGGFAGYAAIEGQQLEVDRLKETEACPADEFFSEVFSEREVAAGRGY